MAKVTEIIKSSLIEIEGKELIKLLRKKYKIPHKSKIISIELKRNQIDIYLRSDSLKKPREWRIEKKG